MNQREDFLQEIIEQLESGKSVADCVDGLPPQETEVVQLIDGMRHLSFPEEDEAVVAAHEAVFLAAAKAKFPPVAAPETKRPLSAIFLSHIQSWLDKLPIQRNLAFGLAALLLLALFAIVWTNFSGRSRDDVPFMAEKNGEDVAEESNPSPPAGVADNLEGAEEDSVVASIPSTPQGPTIYIPLVSFPLNISAETAVIDNIQGVVEIQGSDGKWTAVNRASTINVGQRVRTGKLSQTTLTFYDGSQAYLSANTEISIDELNALRPENGYRTIVMTQWVGESSHTVQFRNDGGSRYEVNTPSGSGIARGTKFHVLVLANQLTRYIVSEGRVDVSNAGRTVSVTAGKLSTIIAGNMPDEPTFNVSGEGEVEAMGAEWTIAGQTFQTDDRTITVGNPQIGDLVSVEGHLLPDGGRVADRIILLRRAIVNRFTLSGQVSAMGSLEWTIAAQTILVNSQTAVIDSEIVIGDNVRVKGIILSDGRLQATRITFVEDMVGYPFEFSGVVQIINADSWTISGKAVAIESQTTIDNAIVVGDVVTVRGIVLADDRWLATDITLMTDDLPTFEFTGIINSITPWQVAGIGFETRAWTVIASGLEVGDLVRVSGSILNDGTKVAVSITLLENGLSDTIVFTGIVSGIEPWIVDGLRLAVNADTYIMAGVEVGSLVRVYARLMGDGSWVVVRIQPLYPDFGIGCLTFSSPVLVVNADTIRVKHWPIDIKRNGRIQIRGNIKVNSVITLPICTGWDGTIIVVGDIIIIYQPIVIIIDDGGNGGGNGRGSGRGSGKDS